MEYPPPQPLDGEVDRLMETDEQHDFIASDSVLPGDVTLAESSTHPASDPGAAPEEDVEEIGSDDEEDEEDDEVEIDLEEEEIDEEEDIEGEEDEDMAEAEGENGDDTMQSIEDHVPANQSIPQIS